MAKYSVVAVSTDGTATRIEVNGCYRDIATDPDADNSELLQTEADNLERDLAAKIADPTELQDRPLAGNSDD